MSAIDKCTLRTLTIDTSYIIKYKLRNMKLKEK